MKISNLRNTLFYVFVVIVQLIPSEVSALTTDIDDSAQGPDCGITIFASNSSPLDFFIIDATAKAINNPIFLELLELGEELSVFSNTPTSVRWSGEILGPCTLQRVYFFKIRHQISQSGYSTLDVVYPHTYPETGFTDQRIIDLGDVSRFFSPILNLEETTVGDNSLPSEPPTPPSDDPTDGGSSPPNPTPPSGGTLYSSNFGGTATGNFPSDLTFRGGSIQVDDSRGDAMLKLEGPSWFHIPLASDLPEHFAIEFDYYTTELYAVLFVAPFDAASSGSQPPSYSGYRQGPFHFFSVANTSRGAAIDAAMDNLPSANGQNSAFTAGVVAIRLEVSGSQAKVFVGGAQVAMLPAATIRRTNVLELFYGSMGAPGNGYLGDIRISAN